MFAAISLAPSAPGQEAPPDPVAVPFLDVFDVIRRHFHKTPEGDASQRSDGRGPLFTLVPVFGYNPATGLSMGIGASAAFFRGDKETTKISSVLTSLKVTTQDQVVFSTRVNAFTGSDRWNLASDTRFNLSNQDTYALGTGSSSESVNLAYDYLRLFETAYRQVRPKVFVGLSFLYSGYSHVHPTSSGANSEESAYALRSREQGLDQDAQASAGGSVDLLVDSRDSSINPSRGSYADLKYEAHFRGFLNGSSDWDLLHCDLRTYRRLTRDARRRLAFWLFGDFVTGGAAPYFDLPATASDTYGRSGRGYVPGRFRGDSMLYAEVEYRWTFTKSGLLGMVAFLNTETLSGQGGGERLFDSLAPGGGTGLRVLLNKRSKTNLCVDFGVGEEGSKGLYVGVQEAF